MGRLVRIVVSMLLTMALGLSATSPAMAKGGSTTTPSAGDNQYIDPLAPQVKPHHKRKHPSGTPAQHSSSTSTSSVGSSNQSSPPTTGQTAPPVTTSGSNVSAPAGTEPAHTKRPRTARRAKAHSSAATTNTTGTTGTTATTVAASPSASINPPSHSSGSFPYVYVIVAACAALIAAFLGRHLMLRRAARHG